jgi:hypothetical protein
MLDNLEKLTSETSELSENGNVQLQYLRVKDGKRKEWHIAHDIPQRDDNILQQGGPPHRGDYVFTCASANQQDKQQIEELAKKHDRGLLRLMRWEDTDQGLKLLIPATHRDRFTAVFTDDRVKAFKSSD